MEKKDRLTVIRIVSIYAAVSTLWIYFSDRLLWWLIRDPESLAEISVYKGWGFIIVTLVLLYRLISGYVAQLRQTESALRRANAELEQRVAHRTADLAAKQEELEGRNAELMEAYKRLEAQAAERIRAMEELRARDRLLIQQSRMAAMGEMLGNIAHQWRQPLNVLGLRLQHLGLAYEMGRFSGELLNENLAGALDILRQLSLTIDEFRRLSYQEREKSVFRLGKIISRTVAMISASFSEQYIAIQVDAPDDMEIYGYRNQYAHALLNILMNARDALLERKVADARVRIRSRSEAGRSVVTVTDNAGGIDEGIIDRIFDAYFTTKEQGKGTGVGLFMAKTFIETNMGGRLTCRNVAGGAEFRIEVQGLWAERQGLGLGT